MPQPSESGDARRRNIESYRKEAKQWLRALRGANHESDAAASDARARYERAVGAPPLNPTLRDVQHALAREHGFAGWNELKQSVSELTRDSRALAEFEIKARALYDAYYLGTPEAMERHYSFTWHRRAWDGMRRYVQLDLGKRAADDNTDHSANIDITMDDARHLVAVEHQFESWDDLQAYLESLPPDANVTASPTTARAGIEKGAPAVVVSREWARVLEALEQHPGAALEANGQLTNEMLAEVARIPHVSALRLGNCQKVTDDGVRHLAGMQSLRELSLAQTAITDDSLSVLRSLPALEDVSLEMTRVTDAGMQELIPCEQLRRVQLRWTATGDGAIRALAGKPNLTHFWSGNGVTDDGIAALHDIPAFAEWRGGEARFGILENDQAPNHVDLRGPITDRGIERMRGLDGVCVLFLDQCALSDRASALEPLVRLRNLAKLSVDPKQAWMRTIARMPALRFISMQDAEITDEGFVDLAGSQSLEYLWGRRSHGLGAAGFRALGRMPNLRGLSTSCLNVPDEALSVLPEFPALRALMPMDIPDAGYRHIGQCGNLEALLLMYCRGSTDAATEQIVGLRKLTRYFNSYTEITDRTPELLAGMVSLERITFDSCHRLTDAGVARLALLPRLRELSVSGNALTPAVARMFPDGVTVRYST
ncbi:MAG: hypothetical protein ACO1Q7_19105 [Gemmatimonas sp.]